MENSTKSSGASSDFQPRRVDIWLLGLTIVIGGQYFCWNEGLQAGLYSYFIAFLLIGLAYAMLVCCTSEICGALPFAGGAYGLSRCTLGFFPGFLIGCCEALEYIVYVATSVISFGAMIVTAVPSAKGYEPLIWLSFYLSALWIYMKGGKVFWMFNRAIGVVSLLILLLYVFGSLSFVDFKANVSAHQLGDFNGSAAFMKALPLAAWFFVGVEALPMTCDQMGAPKTTVPLAQVACVSTLFITGVMVFFVTVSLPPAAVALSADLVPFNNGFTRMFSLTEAAATVLSLPATYATAFGFIWCYGKLIAAMAESRLLLHHLSVKSADGTPMRALAAGSVLSYIFCLLAYFVPAMGGYLFRVCIISGFMSYTGQCIGYLSLKKNFKGIRSSSFRNPFGIWGAFFSMSVWILALVASLGFSPHGGTEALVFGCVVFVVGMYYRFYAKKRQVFSAKENKVLLVAHVTKFNSTKAKRRVRSSDHSKGGSKSRVAARGSKEKRYAVSNSHTSAAETGDRTTTGHPTTSTAGVPRGGAVDPSASK